MALAVASGDEPRIAEVVGEERTVAAFIHIGAQYEAPGRIYFADKGAFFIGEVDGSESLRVGKLAADIRDAEFSSDILAYMWTKLAYCAWLNAIDVSGLTLYEALDNRRYHPLFFAFFEEVLAQTPVTPKSFGEVDPADPEGTFKRIADRARVGQSYSTSYLDLAVYKRKTEIDGMIGMLEGPLTRHVVAMVHEIERGKRNCEVANIETLRTHALAPA